jgi:(p)ppGpp synthase/HD superfamily hydrolase
MPTITKTKILVKAGLTGQSDAHGVSKYDHCVRVWGNSRKLFRDYNITDAKIRSDGELVALLHDIIEDSDLNENDLHLFGYSNKVIDAVKLVTHDESGSYSDYIDVLCRSGNLLALIAKLADNLDNTSEARTVLLDQKFKDYLGQRYAGVREKLIAAIEALV